MQRSNDVLAVPVNGEAGAQNYLVGAGNTVLLTDFNAGRIWLKSNDPQGLFQSLRTFEFLQGYNQQYGNMSPQQVVQNMLNQGKMSQADFNRYRKIANKLTGLNN